MSRVIAKLSAELDALQAAVVESNRMLHTLHFIATLPAKKLRFSAGTGIPSLKGKLRLATALNKLNINDEGLGLWKIAERLNALADRYPTEAATVRGLRQWIIENPDLSSSGHGNGGLQRIVAGWFDKLDAAYAIAKSDETRIVLTDLAALTPRWEYQPHPFPDEGRHIFREARDPHGVFLRKFEAKQLAAERALAALAVRLNAGNEIPQRSVTQTKMAEGAEYVAAQPGAKGPAIAKAIHVSPSHFRTNILPKMKKDHGVRRIPGKQGYYPPEV